MSFLYRLIFIAAALTVFTQVNGDCAQKSICQNPRDIITHTSEDTNITEQIDSHEMWWKIIPGNTNGNVLLAFKKFVTMETDVVNVYITKKNNQVDVRTFRGQLGNFEIVDTGVENVLVNFTKTFETRVNFSLYYYGDCGFATVNPVTHFGIEEGQKCTIFVPETNSNFNRMYVTMRNVKLQANLHLKVQDIHTLSTLADIKKEEYYQVVAVESDSDIGGSSSFFTLIDLECSTDNCDYENNHYLISFYVLTRSDTSCIEFQKLCLENPYDFPLGWCQTICPAMVKTMEQEYNFEIYPSLLEENNSTASFSSATPTLKKQYCPLAERLCQCKSSRRKDLRYCLRKTKCLKLREQGCTWRCILLKVISCPKIKRLERTLI